MTTTPENQPHITKTPDEIIRGLELSRDRLQRTFETLGTAEYTEKGGIKLNLNSVSGDTLIERALTVGTINQRIREEKLPTIENKIRDAKVSIIRTFIDAGYLPESVFDENEAVESTTSSTEEAEQALTPGVAVVIPKEPEDEAAQPQVAAAAEATNKKVEDEKLSVVEIDKDTGRMVIDGREFKFRPSSGTWQLILHFWEKRNSYIDGKDVQTFLLEEDIQSPPAQIVFSIRRTIDDLQDRRVMRSQSHGKNGIGYGIFAKTDESMHSAGEDVPLGELSVDAPALRPPVPEENSVDRMIATPDVAIAAGEAALGVKDLRGDERQQPFEIDYERQANLCKNLTLSVLSYLSDNDPSSIIINNPAVLVRNQVGAMLRPSESHDEAVRRLTGVNTNDELGSFYLESFTFILDESWGQEEIDNIVGARDRQIAKYCKNISDKGVSKAQVVFEVCRHFGLKLPQEYEGTEPNPSIRLYSSDDASTAQPTLQTASEARNYL